MGIQEDLADYVERSSGIIDESPQMDEQNTKRKIIEPLIEVLGWDILSSDVELEYSVQIGTGTKKVDYSLNLEGTPVVFVEAKGCDTTIIDIHRNQLRSYMRQVGVDWGLLANGRVFEIYRRDHSSSRPNENSLAQFSLQEATDHRQILKALSKDSIDTGESRQIAEKVEAAQKAVRTLQKNKEQLAEEVAGVVTNIIGESISQHVEDEAKIFVDNVISSLEDQAHRTDIAQTRRTTISASDGRRTGGRSTSESRSAPENDYTVQLTEEDTMIYSASGDIQAKVMADTVDYLFQNRDLGEEIELPFVPGTGKGKYALVNEDPVHTDGGEMRLYEELSNGWYLYTALGAEPKKRYISQLVEKVGLECEYGGDW